MNYELYGFSDVILPANVELENGKWITFKDKEGNVYETTIYFIESINKEEK